MHDMIASTDRLDILGYRSYGTVSHHCGWNGACGTVGEGAYLGLGMYDMLLASYRYAEEVLGMKVFSEQRSLVPEEPGM